MKTIEESVLLDYSKEQLMEVIDSATSYDISTVLFTIGMSNLGFDSFNSYIQDLLSNSDASDVGELLSLEPAEPKDVTDDGTAFGQLEESSLNPLLASDILNVFKVFKKIRRFFFFLSMAFIILMPFGVILMLIEDWTGLDLDNLGVFLVLTVGCLYLSYQLVYKKLPHWKNMIIEKFDRKNSKV